MTNHGGWPMLSSASSTGLSRKKNSRCQTVSTKRVKIDNLMNVKGREYIL